MKAMKILFASLLFAMCAGRASADSFSLFTGTITQAPTGNVFGVTTGEKISGVVLYPSNPVFPNNPIFIDSNVEVGVTISSIRYEPVLASGDESVSISTTTGLITGITWQYPTSPIRPSLTLSGDQFFTTDCQPGAVCGTLNFSNSQITATPEPPTLILMAAGILLLGFWATRRGWVKVTAQLHTGPDAPSPA